MKRPHQPTMDFHTHTHTHMIIDVILHMRRRIVTEELEVHISQNSNEDQQQIRHHTSKRTASRLYLLLRSEDEHHTDPRRHRIEVIPLATTDRRRHETFIPLAVYTHTHTPLAVTNRKRISYRGIYLLQCEDHSEKELGLHKGLNAELLAAATCMNVCSFAIQPTSCQLPALGSQHLWPWCRSLPCNRFLAQLTIW